MNPAAKTSSTGHHFNGSVLSLHRLPSNTTVPKSHASGTIHKDMLRGVFGATYAWQSAGAF